MLAAATSPAPGGPAEVRDALMALFAREDPPVAKQEIDRVLAACDNDAEKLKAAIVADTAYEKPRPLWQRFTTKVADGNTVYDVEFQVRVPKSYTPEKSWPLLLAAHGQGGTGGHIGAMMEELVGRQVDDYVIVAPTMPGPKFYSGQPYQEQSYLKPLTWAKRHVNIDGDRVFVVGYSQGGHCTWHLATLYPHLFAGAVPMAGVPWFEGGSLVHDMYLENLSNLPMWAIWGEKDGAAPPVWGNVDFCRSAAKRLKELDNKLFRGTELPGVGHGGCFPSQKEFLKFLAANKRQPVPAKMAHFFHLAHHGRGYYLEATALTVKPLDLSKPIQVPVPAGQQPTNENALNAVKDHLAKSVCKVWGELDSPRNTLTVKAQSVRTVRLYVTEGMFDLSKPVTIRFWSHAWTGKVPVSARCLITHYAADRDRSALVYNEIDLDVSGKARIQYDR